MEDFESGKRQSPLELQIDNKQPLFHQQPQQSSLVQSMLHGLRSPFDTFYSTLDDPLPSQTHSSLDRISSLFETTF